MLFEKFGKEILRVLCYFIALIILGCAVWWSIIKIVTWQKASYFAPLAYHAFSADFYRAGLEYPPRQLAFLVFKNTKQLEVYARDKQQWKYIKTFPIFAASGHAGPKLHEGDRQVPEGIYKIINLNPFSHYTLSMEINYPNAFDKAHAQLDHRAQLGGDIYIHGSDLSIGCMAMGDTGIKQLFPLVYAAGIENVEVIIAPNDLRIKKAIRYPAEPIWTAELYRDIAKKLSEFRLPLGSGLPY